MMRIGRETFLSSLESMQPGLSKRDIVEQSSCFVFKKGRIYTYNSEISCCIKTTVQLEGAVRAEPLLSVLRKMPEEEVSIEQTDDTELVILGTKRKAGIQMDQELTLPLNDVEKPGDWLDLPADFSEAVNITNQCASNDESAFVITCVHLHPKYMEATDNDQAVRYTIKLPIEQPFLVKASSLKELVSLGVAKISETPTWVHFRNAAGLRISIKRHLEEYKNLGKFLTMEGEAISFPKGLVESVEAAQIFSEENADHNLLFIDIKPGKLKIEGRGASGWYQEWKKLPGYKGIKMRFLISPGLLSELTKKHNECLISEQFLKVDGGKFRYLTCLATEEEMSDSAPAEEAGEE